MPEALRDSASALSTPATVWVVDDSVLDGRHAQAALADCCHVELFTDGSAALERIASGPPPDVLVLDWVMPGVSGIEVVQFLRSGSKQMPQVPVLLLTAHNQPEQIAHGLSAGANDYLSKPYAVEELRARVEALVRSARLTERLIASERVISTLLENAPDAVFAVDQSGHVVYANAEAGRTVGRTPEELQGAVLGSIIPTLRLSQSHRESGHTPLPLPDVTLGDRVFAVSVRVLPTDPAATTTLMLRDVTARRRAEERRLDFYSIIAHDLRSPLNAMVLRTAFMLEAKRGSLPVDVVEQLHKFDRSMRSMVTIINDFLDLARLEGSAHRMERVELDFRNVVDTVVDELRPLAEAGKLHLHWAPPADPIYVLGDPSRLGQVLSNLIGNAIKFTPPNGTIDVVASDLGDSVELSIRDTGPGVPPAMIPRLFDRFTRDPSQERTIGSGLGLMIVKEIIEAHAGKVGVKSTTAGATFWIRLQKSQTLGADGLMRDVLPQAGAVGSQV